MITIVDHHNGVVVQKITKPSGKLVRYQTVPENVGDASAVKVFISLADARQSIGKSPSGKVDRVADVR